MDRLDSITLRAPHMPKERICSAAIMSDDLSHLRNGRASLGVGVW
jgi:hypothetical protein